MCKVSIIMPSYNVAPYIRECMDSVVNQTLKDIEIIVVDASSSDGTREILDEYAGKDPRIHILVDDKNSTGYANNKAIDYATGEYIGIVETDDYVVPEMFEKLYKIAKQTGCDIVKGDYDSFSGNGDKRLFVKHNVLEGGSKKYNKILNPIKEARIFDAVMFNWAGIYKKSFLDKFRIRHQETPGASFQDNGFYFQAYALADSVYFTHESFYRYRKDNPNSSINNPDKVFCMCDEYDYIESCLKHYPDIWEAVYYRYLRRRYGACSWTLKKVAPEYRSELVGRMAKDFRRFIKTEDEIKKIQSIKRYRNEMRLLLTDKEEYLKKIFSNQDRYTENIEKLCGLLKNKDVILFGAGECGTQLDVILRGQGIQAKCYVDNNVKLQGTRFNGKEILPVDRGVQIYKNGYFIITTQVKRKTIEEQLLSLGVDHENVMCYYAGRYVWD